ncbi:discoidin domain-containing protein, partial [Candidatus Poribacteria bacterium]|nr:discoidin domain-containing protein [Candidatus Poribacteria bacterium]
MKKFTCYLFIAFFLTALSLSIVACSGQSMRTRDILMSPEQKLVNYALASNGGTAESTDNNPDHPPSEVIDGDISSLDWDKGGGWEGGLSRYRLKDLLKLSYIQVNLPGPKQVKRIVVYTLDSPKYPAKEFGLRTYRLEYRHGTGWEKVRLIEDGNEKLFAVKDNKEGKIVHEIDGELITDKIRLVPIYSNDIDRTYNLTAYAGRSFYSVEGAARVIEMEVWCSPDTPGMAISE